MEVPLRTHKNFRASYWAAPSS